MGFALWAALAVADPVRVACVGDSITFGAGIKDRDRASYPAQLQALLGNEYEVRNFGVSGRTLLTRGDAPWVKEPACQQAVEFQPKVVVIKLGSNDSKPHNWVHAAEFASDAVALVKRFQELPSKPRVILCAPAPAFKGDQGEDVFGIRDGVIVAEQIPVLRQVAKQCGVEFVDLHQEFLLHGVAKVMTWFPDKIHPDPFGAEVMARRLAEQIREAYDIGFDLVKSLESMKVKVTTVEWLGYRKLEVPAPGKAGGALTLVAPHTAAAGHPWIWRTGAFGVEASLDLALLDRGFHVVYVKTDGLYGNAQAMSRWDEAYAFARKSGLGAKPLIETMGDGGLEAFAWVRKHPTQVAGIYADQPAVDLRTWTESEDKSKILEARRVNGLSDQGEIKGEAFRGFEELAKAKVPLFVVVGDKDGVIPADTNGKQLVEKYRQMGGAATLWVKSGAKHLPYGLDPVFPLLRGLLRAQGRLWMPSTWPTPSVEFRAGAGWNGRTWFQELEQIRKTLSETESPQLLFLGDSISQGWVDSEHRVAVADGKRLFDQRYGKYRAVSCGMSGNRTEQVLAMLEAGLLDGVHPKAIVVAIGVNNAVSGEQTGEEIAAGTIRIVEQLKRRQPQARVLLFGAFPAKAVGSMPRQAIDESHRLLAIWAKSKAGKGVTYLDPRGAFLKPDGSLGPGIRNDEIHFAGDVGYRLWADLLEPALKPVFSP